MWHSLVLRPRRVNLSRPRVAIWPCRLIFHQATVSWSVKNRPTADEFVES